MKRYTKYIKPYLIYFILGPILMITEVLGEVILPSLVANLINQGVPQGDISYILKIGLMMVGVIVLMLIGGIGGNYFIVKAAINFSGDLRKDVFSKVQEFSFANIDSFSTGSLVTRLTNDITQIQNVLRMGLIMLLRSPGLLIGALVMAIRMNASLSIIVAVVIPVLTISMFLIMRTAFPRFEIMQKKIDALNSNIQENLTNVRVVKSFVRHDVEEAKFAKANQELKENSLRAYQLVILTMPVMTVLMNITTLAVVWFGGQQIITGRMPVGNLTAFTTYITQILMSLMMLAMVLLAGSRAIASFRRVNEILDTKVDLNDDKAEEKELTVKRGEIEFRSVSFKYYTNKPEYVLENISFHINPGETVGIIGSTGCGKTTMVQLIPRLYDTLEGEVLVDGVDVKEYSLKNLRNGVGMVLQKNVLFSGTIMENLRWGDEEASEEDIQKAAKSAMAHDFIMSFPNGYETELGQGGVNISGGQKQRLCIARALLKQPRILILDDSTSAVDTATESRIRESFAMTLKETTKLIIAQRITSVIEADKILVMDEGRLVGMGQHSELLANCETYQEIYYSQMDREVTA